MAVTNKFLEKLYTKNNFKRTNSCEWELDSYPEFMALGGAVNYKKLNSIWMKIQFHLFCDDDKGIEELKYLFWGVKQTVKKRLNPEFYKTKFISFLEFSESFKVKNYTHVEMDFTFYTNTEESKKFHKAALNELLPYIHKENFLNTPFRLYSHKRHIAKHEDTHIHRIRTSD